MALVPAATLVRGAYGRGGGVAAVEVVTLEHAEGIVLGAEQAGLPVILQVGQAAATFHLGDPAPLAAALAALAKTSLVDVALHLDRATEDGLLYRAADCGFSAVGVDPGRRPYAEAVDLVAEAARWGREQGLWVQAELGQVNADGELESAQGGGVTTDPEQAADFVLRTGVNALAVGIGLDRADDVAADLDLIRRLAAAVPVPLVALGPAGVPQPVMGPAVTAGITTVVFGPVTTRAMTRVIRQHLHDLPDVHDPPQYLAPARKAVSAVVAELIATVGLAPSSH